MSETKRAKYTVAAQQGALGRMQKHIEKRWAATEAIKKVNESIQVGCAWAQGLQRLGH